MRAQIAGLVGELCAAGVEPAVDSRRVLLCGTSMGGDGVWTLAAARPELFAACVPVCAAANLAAVAHLDHKPTWIFHGVDDGVVPIEGADAMAEALRSRGDPARVRYSRIDECPTPEGAPHAVGHAAWMIAFAEESGLWGWLLERVNDT